jgi:zinc/manganese transport system substrate-binding protein
MDPVRMIQAVDIIATELAPIAGGGVAARADSYKAELEVLHEEIAEMIESIPVERRVMVTNHFAYGYYADRYGLEILGAVIPAATTDAETSARDFAELIELIEAEDVPAIFASTTEPTELAEVIGGEVGRDVAVIELYTESLGEPGSGADTYVGMMRTSTERIVEGLAS